MVVSNEVITKRLVVHRIVDGRLIPSREGATVSTPDINSWITKFLFKPFNSDEQFAFVSGESPLSMKMLAQEVFQSQELAIEKSIQIAEYYLANAHSQNCKDGEFILAYFEDCVVEDEVTDVLGIFRVEKKEAFLKLEPTYDSFVLRRDEGVSPARIGQGALIFNTDQENGYKCLVIDKVGPRKDEFSWKEQFLAVEKVVDSYFHTQHLINNIQEFAQAAYEEGQSAEKITLVNDTLDFMKENDFFDKEVYAERVLQAPELIERFESFQEEKVNETPDLETGHFEISKPAIKSTKRYIRSVIKLDGNFHVYVHGNRENIIRGYDQEKGKHFYTLFYDEET